MDGIWDWVTEGWRWVRIGLSTAAFVIALNMAVAAQDAWNEDKAWSPRVLGLVIMTIAAAAFCVFMLLPLW